jgi:biotin operon repressor
MTDTATKLSDTARIVLTRAAEHRERLVSFHKKLPAGARHKVAESLLKQGLLEETAGTYRDAPVTEQDGGMLLTTLRITDAGFRAIGAEPPTAPRAASPEAVAQEAAAVADALDAAPVAPAGANGRDTLRHAALALLDAWRGITSLDAVAIAGAMNPAIARLDAALATPAPRAERAPRGPRQGTKQEQVLAMLRRADGASGPQIAEATGWNSNTVRGFLAGLKKKGIKVETLERVRMVGPNKEGAKGSFTVYRLGA